MQKYSSRIAWCNYCHDDNGYEGEFDWSIAYATRAEYDAAMAQVEGIINAHKKK